MISKWIVSTKQIVEGHVNGGCLGCQYDHGQKNKLKSTERVGQEHLAGRVRGIVTLSPINFISIFTAQRNDQSHIITNTILRNVSYGLRYLNSQGKDSYHQIARLIASIRYARYKLECYEKCGGTSGIVVVMSMDFMVAGLHFGYTFFHQCFDVMQPRHGGAKENIELNTTPVITQSVGSTTYLWKHFVSLAWYRCFDMILHGVDVAVNHGKKQLRYEVAFHMKTVV